MAIGRIQFLVGFLCPSVNGDSPEGFSKTVLSLQAFLEGQSGDYTQDGLESENTGSTEARKLF